MNNDYQTEHGKSLQFPTPLKKGNVVETIGTFDTPALMLTIFSIFAFGSILLFLQFNTELRDCFHVENYSDNAEKIFLGISIISTLLAWIIGIASSKRPSKLFCFLWIISLSLFISLLTACQFGKSFFPQEKLPLLDAFTAASIGAVLTLSPRLIRLYPDSRWLQKISFVSLIATLVLVSTIVWYLAHDISGLQQKDFLKTVDSLNQTQQALRACGSENTKCLPELFSKALALQEKPFESCWKQSTETEKQDFTNAQASLLTTLIMKSSEQLVSEIKSGLKSEKPITLNNSTTFYQFKTLLGKAKGQIENNSDIQKSYTDLLNVAADALNLDNPHILNESPVTTEVLKDEKNGNKKNDYGPWPLNPRFSTKSQQVISYFQGVGQLFQELQALSDLESFPELNKQSAIKAWNQHVNEIKSSWSHHWLVGYLGNEQESLWTLNEVLTRPIFGNLSLPTIPYKNTFFNMDFNEMVLLAQSSKNCIEKPSANHNSSGDAISTLTCLSYINHHNQVQARLYFKFNNNPNNRVVSKEIALYIPVLEGEDYKAIIEQIRESLTYTQNAILRLGNDYQNYECIANEICVSVENYLNREQKYIKVMIYPRN